MKKKIAVILGLLLVALLAVVGIGAVTGSASATSENRPEISGKPVEVCHATSSETNPYVKLPNVPLVQFFGHNGHYDHEGDIWAPFSYIQRIDSEHWETIEVPGQGDQSLLEFEDCEKPREDVPVVAPEVVYNDPCGTSNDSFSVVGGTGYTVEPVITRSGNLVIVVKLLEGFKWASGDAYGDREFVRPVFSDVNCDLPETGAPEMATAAGWTAVGGIALLGLLAMGAQLRRREN